MMAMWAEIAAQRVERVRLLRKAAGELGVGTSLVDSVERFPSPDKMSARDAAQQLLMMKHSPLRTAAGDSPKTSPPGPVRTMLKKVTDAVNPAEIWREIRRKQQAKFYSKYIRGK